MFQVEVLDINNNQKCISMLLLNAIKGYSSLISGDEVLVLKGFYKGMISIQYFLLDNKAIVLCSYRDRVFMFNPKFSN